MKKIFIIINSFLIVAMAYFCVDIVYKKMLPGRFFLLEKGALKSKTVMTRSGETEPSITQTQLNGIVDRNFFNVEVEEQGETPLAEVNRSQELEKTHLDLLLFGTVTGMSDLFAVIEDKKNRQQALYRTGESIQGAIIKSISRHEVILTYQGKDQVLEMVSDVNRTASPAQPFIKNESHEMNSAQNPIINNVVSKIAALSAPVKFRPHFVEGALNGIMVYGIRPDSAFFRAGLRNGDIVKDIDGAAILSVEDASRLFSEMDDADMFRLNLIRRGEIKELVYQAAEPDADAGPIPEDDDADVGPLPAPDDKEKGEE